MLSLIVIDYKYDSYDITIEIFEVNFFFFPPPPPPPLKEKARYGYIYFVKLMRWYDYNVGSVEMSISSIYQ